jgi:hypothetical protein
MSAGTPITTIRLPRALHAEIDAYLARRNELTLVDPWTMTDWLIAASRELLRKKAWRRGKPVVFQQSVEDDMEITIENILQSEERLALGKGEGI